MKKFLFFLAFIGTAITALAQDMPDPLYVYRADGMKIKLTSKVNASSATWYLYNEPGFWHSKNKAQSMWDVAVILGKDSAKNINDSNRSHDMKDDSGNYYTVTLPSLGEYYALTMASGGRPGPWHSDLDGGAEFWTSTYDWNDHRTVDVWNYHTFTRWDTDHRVVAFKVRKWLPYEAERKNNEGRAINCLKTDITSTGVYPNVVRKVDVTNACKYNQLRVILQYTTPANPSQFTSDARILGTGQTVHIENVKYYADPVVNWGAGTGG